MYCLLSMQIHSEPHLYLVNICWIATIFQVLLLVLLQLFPYFILSIALVLWTRFFLLLFDFVLFASIMQLRILKLTKGKYTLKTTKIRTRLQIQGSESLNRIRKKIFSPPPPKFMLILPWFADNCIHKMDEILFKNDNYKKSFIVLFKNFLQQIPSISKKEQF